MGFDWGHGIVLALVVGAILAAFGHGSAFMSQWIEDWKNRRWDDKHRHLSPEQRQAVRDEIAAAKARVSKRIDRVVYGIIVVATGLLVYLTKR